MERLTNIDIKRSENVIKIDNISWTAARGLLTTHLTWQGQPFVSA